MGTEEAKDGAKDLKDKWVVMIYMAATSPRLCDAMERDLKEFNDRLSNLLDVDDLYVVIQADTPDGQYVSRQRLLGGGRVKALPPCRLPSPEDLAKTKLTAKQYFIANFVDWRFHNDDCHWPGSRRTTPPTVQETAENIRNGSPVSKFGKTLLILWGHSQGIAAALSQPGSPAFAMVGSGGFGFDPLYGDALTLAQIRCALVEGLRCQPRAPCRPPHRIDILSFDSCFMSAAEAAVELQEYPYKQAGGCGNQQLRLDFLLAAQTAILLDGLDYSRLADVFVQDSCVQPKELGLRVLSQAAYGNDSPTSLSLLRLSTRGQAHPKKSSSAAFEASFKALVDALREVLPSSEKSSLARLTAPPMGTANRAEWLRIRDAFESATWHRVRQFVDLGDLCRRLLNNSREPNLRTAAWRVLAELKTEEPGVPGESFLVDVRTAHPHILSGVSVYCPWLHPTPAETREGAWNAVVSLDDYDDLRFSKSTGWGAFLLKAKALLEEARQRSINAELEDLRRAIDLAATGRTDPPARTDFERFRVEGPKPGNDKFQTAEPDKPRRYGDDRPTSKQMDFYLLAAEDAAAPIKKAPNLLATE